MPSRLHRTKFVLEFGRGWRQKFGPTNLEAVPHYVHVGLRVSSEAHISREHRDGRKLPNRFLHYHHMVPYHSRGMVAHNI